MLFAEVLPVLDDDLDDVFVPVFVDVFDDVFEAAFEVLFALVPEDFVDAAFVFVFFCAIT